MAEQPETTHPAEREAQTAPPLNLEGPRLARLLMAAMVQATPTVPLVVAAADRTARESLAAMAAMDRSGTPRMEPEAAQAAQDQPEA
jgi:hypothetical protein